ncbi:MAG: carboxypeptidase regulatory-like domain-containing protein [Chloroflexi bacterium]|nr:carboxypeptidase regulatory-like domain-containing protein [Chloroflexota bacterium]
MLAAGALVFRAFAPQTASPLSTLEPIPVAATPLAEGTPFKLLTPGPTVPAGHWRWTGQVLDGDGKPLPGVCVHIGPGECHFTSITTDADGRWVIDFPQVDVMYEFHFSKDGYAQVDQTVRTTGPRDLDVRMVRR